ncbi:alanyl-tRNA editing protein [Paenibacillus glufosinatiresistens]|uniref:alanyl-tRNA editing protein n=1 Tax=Paenibacillus glufosinatiresistens TaxID=3070657 RepID=UPI00286D75DE|nr:alanyl-tRNA editing protein [Paenibacillus sp. YX.27]
MTNQLYDSSPYLREWRSTIEWKRPAGGGGWEAGLAETAFYPHGGGQPCDRGEIAGIRVTDVTRDGEAVIHRLESEPPEGEVLCRIDWERRFDHMQHHSGQHLLSAVCLEEAGAPTLSFHLGTEYATIDIERSELSPDEMAGLEREANRLVIRNVPVRSYWVTPEEAAELPLVKPPSVTGNVRIVEMEGVEYNACGGTHVARTGEIGPVKLLRSEKHKGHVRLYFKCGFRALEDYAESAGVLTALSVKLGAPRLELMQRVEKLEQEQHGLLAELQRLRTESDGFLVRELLNARQGGFIAHRAGSRPLKELQALAVRIAEEGGTPALLLDEDAGKVVLASGGEPPCGAWFKAALPGTGGKGGGGEKLAQAAFASSDEAERFFRDMIDKLTAHFDSM